MIILPYGENALLVNFEQRIDLAINQKVIWLRQSLIELDGITFTIPAYASLTVGFDPAKISLDDIKTYIHSIDFPGKAANIHGPTYLIPVCYEGEYAPDMEEVSKLTGLSKSEIIELHTKDPFNVFMLGLVAGFAYMGTLPDSLTCPRKHMPRKVVKQGAVGLAGNQTGIYPTDLPGGWQLIGRTPLKIFDPTHEFPVRLQPGDAVQFCAINEADYISITNRVEAGTYEWEVLHG